MQVITKNNGVSLLHFCQFCNNPGTGSRFIVYTLYENVMVLSNISHFSTQ